jgi:hypothetical protein
MNRELEDDRKSKSEHQHTGGAIQIMFPISLQQ